ncbi:lysophospholipid acyltransferase family protein [Marinobacter sp.]|uniref:lysophospholipid acyltransferase family protein n=1 Tax=Marinobacter sp. TaxID=50741 RepID=UPI0019E78E7C|nr:lysophospholipid acyltransferase family protein [Marinobacter sp.]MBE0486053.1 lysophospholipid acyltransferase family protein [Marinobacter sp.]
MSLNEQPANTQATHSLKQRAASKLLRTAGWNIHRFPDIPKAMVVAGPHTSNWDGVLGLACGLALGLDARFMIKHTLFKGPLGWLLRKFGAIPVDRSQAGGIVGQAVEQFNTNDHMAIVVTPEGTRHNASKWKTGFHHIARQAGVPIVLAVADYRKKQLTFPVILQPSDDLEADMQQLYEGFAEATPRRPERLSEPVKVLWEAKNLVRK